ncbi:hypothetical protein AAFF_G00177110 [Aldrovandia affinis]|uniref:Interleukin-2 receptor subunit beta n=1 Tax=Aldrovandia affinis TaxID=143900 RepID=A0AAD7RL39_9TELE|nr:hypothetical protein AAFF_G00177110 [Aldrovandia affinis]
METVWLVSLLLLLSVQALPSHALQGLICVNDYIKNISCNWNSSGIRPEEHCVLQDKERHGHGCDLQPMEGLEHNLRSCQLAFNEEFSYYYKVNINVVCGTTLVASLKDYRPAFNVQMHPPGKPVIARLNISWSLGHPHSDVIDYVFELQYKLSDQLWQDAVALDLMVKQMSVELTKDRLEEGRSYQARVRVKPPVRQGNSIAVKGEWSNWSPIASWTTPGKGLGSQLWITLGLVAAVTVLLLLITCRGGWAYKLKFSHVPNPSTYFEALNSVHGGDFKKWLSPLFVPESYDVTPHFEDISPVEVFKANNITTLLFKEHPKDPSEQWDSSAGSSCFNNMGYFYSDYPGSYEIEVCPVYFSYGTGEGRSQEEGGGEGERLEDIPLQANSTYEQLGDLQGESQHPDPGCGKGNEDQETEKEEEGEGKDVQPLAAVTPQDHWRELVVDPPQ